MSEIEIYQYDAGTAEVVVASANLAALLGAGNKVGDELTEATFYAFRSPSGIPEKVKKLSTGGLTLVDSNTQSVTFLVHFTTADTEQATQSPMSWLITLEAAEWGPVTLPLQSALPTLRIIPRSRLT